MRWKKWVGWLLIFDCVLVGMLFFLYRQPTEKIAVDAAEDVKRFENGLARTIEDSESLPDQARIDVPHIRQKPELARGCEVTALAMMLRYAGVKTDKMTLAHQIRKVGYRQGRLHGDPHRGFVGEIYSLAKPGYGVYHEPLAELAERYLPTQTVDLSEESFSAVLSRIAHGNPVVVITNSTFAPLPEQSFETWQTAEGTVRITWKEHAVLITGYDQQHIYFNNPLGDKNTAANRKAFIAAWKQMGSQAISYRD